MSTSLLARTALAGLLAAAALALAGCAGMPADGSPAASGGGSVEVFGTIDAGVSGVHNKSGR